MKEDVIQYLKDEPRFREREAKWRGISDLIIKKYNLDLDRRKLSDILADASSADRYWRDTLKNNPELRGQDYEDKEVLSQEKQMELGYEVNYETSTAKLKTL